MIIGIRTRIYPTQEQIETLKLNCKYRQDIWNYLVAKYKDNAPKINKFGIKDFNDKDLRKEERFINISGRIIRDVFKKYSETWKMCYSKKGKQPKFHKYNPNKQSFCMEDMYYLINTNNHTIGLGGKAIKKRIPVNMQIFEKYNVFKINNPTFTCLYNKWYLSGFIKIEKEIQPQENAETLGLDWGIKTFFTTSDGEFINYPKTVVREFYRINRLKSIRDKKKKGSNNWNKINLKIQKAYTRLNNLKKDFIEKKTTEMCRVNNITIEDLTNANIIKSNKKRRRLQQISPRASFVNKLKWKCTKFGTKFIEVNPAYTSQTCSKCGVIHKLKLKDRIMNCICGNNLDRDVNAAINIKLKGEVLIAQGNC